MIQAEAVLVVMGSNQITSSVFDCLMASVTIACCRRLEVRGGWGWGVGGRVLGSRDWGGATAGSGAGVQPRHGPFEAGHRGGMAVSWVLLYCTAF